MRVCSQLLALASLTAALHVSQLPSAEEIWGMDERAAATATSWPEGAGRQLQAAVEEPGRFGGTARRAAEGMMLAANMTRPKKKNRGRAPSCNGCARRESVLANQMRLQTYSKLVDTWYAKLALFSLIVVLAMALRSFASMQLVLTLSYALLYLIASPTAILVNKWLMKDYGFGYPVMVSAFGQLTTAFCAWVCVRFFGVSIDTGSRVPTMNMVLLGGASALALTLGQYPYLYLTVAFIQMLKAFSPAYMVFFLYMMGVEKPSRRVVGCVLGLSVCTCIASAGEVNFNVIGVLFMTGASCSDAVRLVVAQKLLSNHKMNPLETLYYTAPVCLLWMVPAALITELPAALQHNSFVIMRRHPAVFIMSGFSGFFVNISSFLLVKRTSSMSLKTMTMARNGGLVMVSALFMGETITTIETVGYSGLLFFFSLYTMVKSQEASERKQSSAVAASDDDVTATAPLCGGGPNCALQKSPIR